MFDYKDLGNKSILVSVNKTAAGQYTQFWRVVESSSRSAKVKRMKVIRLKLSETETAVSPAYEYDENVLKLKKDSLGFYIGDEGKITGKFRVTELFTGDLFKVYKNIFDAGKLK
jgi:hypothetical protein